MTAEENARTITDAIADLSLSGSGRHLIAIAGPPAVGKSTLTELVRSGLNARGLPAGVVPMDGFHFDNAHLETLGLLARKGSPPSFDLPAFQATLKRLQKPGEVRVPLFDRSEDRSVPGRGVVAEGDVYVLVEGNYLLLDAQGWRDLASFWTFSVFVHEDLAELERRLVQRWRDHGLSAGEARARAAGNDLPNAELVMSQRLPCDLEISG